MAVTGGPFASLLRLITQAGAWPLQAWPLQPNPRLGRQEPRDWPATLSVHGSCWPFRLPGCHVPGSSGPSCVSASVILGPQGRSCQGRAGYYSAEIVVRLGAIILGLNQPAQRPVSQSNAQPVRGQGRSGQAEPCHSVPERWTLSERDPVGA
jgi:hypothetical protein